MENAPSSPAVVVRSLTKLFRMGASTVTALRDIDLTIEHGEFVTITGPSGSGKSTLLHMLAGIDRPTSGTVQVGPARLESLSDDDLTLLRRQSIGVIFQAFNLIEVLTVEENVALPLAISGKSSAHIRQRVGQVLEQVGLEQRRNHRPGQLSGGEQQRVAIARALIIEPLLLLADEPTGNLDSTNGDQVMVLLGQLAQSRRLTIVMVTHNKDYAAWTDRCLHMHDGQLVAEHTGLRSGSVRINARSNHENDNLHYSRELQSSGSNRPHLAGGHPGHRDHRGCPVDH